MPVYKWIFGIFYGIEIKQHNDIPRQIMPEKLFCRILARENFFKKFIMSICNLSHNILLSYPTNRSNNISEKLIIFVPLRRNPSFVKRIIPALSLIPVSQHLFLFQHFCIPAFLSSALRLCHSSIFTPLNSEGQQSAFNRGQHPRICSYPSICFISFYP